MAHITSANDQDLKWEFVVNCEYGSIHVSNLWDSNVEDTITICRNNVDGNSHSIENIIVTSEKEFYTLQIDTVNENIHLKRVEAQSPAMNWTDSIGNMRALDMWRQATGLQYPMDQNKN